MIMIMFVDLKRVKICVQKFKSTFNPFSFYRDFHLRLYCKILHSLLDIGTLKLYLNLKYSLLQVIFALFTNILLVITSLNLVIHTKMVLRIYLK